MCSTHGGQVVLCVALLIASHAMASQVFYVDQNHPQANDGNSGTELLPLKTIDRAMVMVQPGDHVYIKGSLEENAPEVVYDRSGKDGLPIQTPGTAGNKIIIEAYPGHTVILQGDGSGHGLPLDNASYHEIRGIVFQNFNKAAEGWAAKTDILIEDCEFTQTHETGLRLRNVTNLTIRDVYVHHCFEAGICVINGTNVLFERVESSYNGPGGSDGFAANYVEHLACIDCVAKANEEDGFDLCSNGVLINCISQDHTRCNVKLWRRDGDGYAPKRMDLVNCIIHGAGEAGIKASQGAELHLYNSVVYDNGEEGIAFRDANANLSVPVITEPVHSEIANTVITQNGTYGIHVAGTTINIVDADHNLYYRNAVVSAGLRSDTSSVTGQDPLFFSPASGLFKLRSGSPAIDAGRPIQEVNDAFSLYCGSAHAEDRDGDRRPSGAGWDIGADERITVAGSTPPTFTSAPEPPPHELHVNEGQTLTVQFGASDPESDALVFFLAGGNVVDGMNIDSRTGTFSFTPTHDQGGNTSSPQQSYDVLVGVTDEHFTEPADQTTIRIVVHNVNRAPSYDGLSLYTLVEGRPWMFGVPAGDADGDVISYSAVGVPSQMALDDSTGVISWTPTAEQVGQHEVKIALSDGMAETVQTITFEVLPKEPYQPPTNEEDIFYVDASNGNDINNGQTEATAWKSIRKAAATLAAGQMVLIRSGVYYEKVEPRSGSLGHPIIYKAYPGGKPILDGSQSGSSPKAFRGGAHLVYDGLTFRNYGETIHCAWSEGDMVIVNCVVENASDYGIYAFTGNRLRIENVELRNIENRGIDCAGTNVHLYNVTIDTVGDQGVSMYYEAVDNVTLINSEVSHAAHFGVRLAGKSTFVYNAQIHDNALIGVDLGARHNFFVSSSIWNTSLVGSDAVNLRFPAETNSKSWVLNSVITGSARWGMYVGFGTWVHMRDTVVSDSAVQDIVVVTPGGTLTDASSLPPDPNNHAPVLTGIGDQSVNEKALLRFSITATDSDGDALTFSAINLPTGASFDPATRIFTWTPTSSQSGTYQVAFRVSDGKSVVSQPVTITVNDVPNHAPVLAAIGDKSVTEGGSLSFPISATDSDGDALTYSVAGLPSGASFASQMFNWRPTYDQAGSYSVTFIVSDGESTDAEKITITVRETANHAPVLAAIGDKSVNENSLLTFSLSATDQDGDSLTFSATGLPSGATFVDGVFNWTPNYSQAGSYQVTFMVSDGELTDAEKVTITVTDRTPSSDQTAPAADQVFPVPETFQAPVNPVIILALSDAGLGVDANAVVIHVNDQLVYTGNSILYNSPDGVCRRTGNPMNYRYYFFPNEPFDFDQPVPVLVNASDLAHNAMTPLSYQFVTEMRSFGQNELVSSNAGNSGHPAIATDSHGNIWATWHTGAAGAADVYVAKQGSDTRQWAAPLRLTNQDSDQRNPVIAIGSNDTIYVAWQGNRRGNWDIYVGISLDGTTWQDPIRVTDPNTNETNPAIAIDHGSPNHVYIAWQQDDALGNQDIYVASSSTRFISKAVSQVTSHAASQTEPALAVGSDNTVYIVWTDQRNGTADIYGSSSASSWNNVPIVTGSGNQHSPAIAVEPGTSTLHMLWTTGVGSNSDVLYGTSNGLPAAPISGTSIVDDIPSADPSAPAILAVKDHWNRNHICACWQDNRNVADAGDSDLYFAEIRSGTAGTNVLVGDDGTNSNQSTPALGFDRYGEPVVLWVDDRSHTAQIYSAYSTYSEPVALVSGTIPSLTGGRVGPDPTSIRNDGDISIGIASNALGCDAPLVISEIQNVQKFGALCLAGYEISPSGIQFSTPATVVIPYRASGSGPGSPYWYDPQTGTLSQLGLTNIMRATLPNGLSVVSFDTTHLTSFYVLAGSSGGGGGGGGGGGCALSRTPEGSIAGYFLPYGALALFLLVRRRMDRRHT